MTNRIPNNTFQNELSDLLLLRDISKIFSNSEDIKKAITPVLELVSNHFGLLSCTISFVDKETENIWIDKAIGLSEEQKSKGKYKSGEGILGRVVSTGKTAIIPKISEENDFLGRTLSQIKIDSKEISFISVPILFENRIIGTLNGSKIFDKKYSLNIVGKVFEIIASMISSAAKQRYQLLQERKRFEEENSRLQLEIKGNFKLSMLIGNSKVMRLVYTQIKQVCKSPTTVLLTGESGTGKELVAHALHYNSNRADKPFIKVNCAALPDNLIESELFGHEKGAFTGAIQRRLGRFELANKGTLFLDEIGDLSLQTQVKLLRFLQEREFERVGGFETIKSDVRIIAATHKNLDELIEQNIFRQDLYYRLNVYPIYVPALRDKPTDISLLADSFVEKYSKVLGKNVVRISTPAIDMLMSYHWPGNVRELENCIERAVLVTDDNVIRSHHLPPSLQSAEASGTEFKGTLQVALEKVEIEYLIDALKTTCGNASAAAKLLGLTKRIIGLRIEKYNITSKNFRT